MPTQRELNERFSRLYAQVVDNVVSLSHGFATSTSRLLHKEAYPDADDFQQEAAVKLLHVLKVSWDKPDEEVIKIFRTSMINKFRSMYVTSASRSMYFEHTSSIEDIPADDQQLDLLFDEYADRLLKLQDREFDRTVIRLILNPDERLMEIVRQDANASNREIVGNHELYIQHEHLAIRLKVSRPTISRSLARIREKLGPLIGTLNMPR